MENLTLEVLEDGHFPMPDLYGERRSIWFYATMTVLSIFSVFGIVGNFLVICVFKQKRDKLLSTFFILVLAFIDFMTCLVIIPYTIFMEAVQMNTKFDFVCKFYHFLITFNIPLSVLIMVAIAVDRYFCICHPFTRTIDQGRARQIVLLMTAFVTGLGIFTALTYGVQYYDENELVKFNKTFTDPQKTFSMSYMFTDHGFKEVIVYYGKCGLSEKIFSDKVRRIYQAIYASVFIFAIVLVSVLYVNIYVAVHKRRRRRLEQRMANSVSNSNVGGAQMAKINLSEEHIQPAASGDSINDQGAPIPLISPVESPNAVGECGNSKNSNLLSIPEINNKIPEERRPSAQTNTLSSRELYWIANLKTAAILFVVTLVFVITYLPAFFMIHDVIKTNNFVFYMYFANNIANPLIYAFMNKTFREDLALLMKRLLN